MRTQAVQNMERGKIAMEILVSGLPSISQCIHHNQQGQQYIRGGKTLWFVTKTEGEFVYIHCVNGWERLIQEIVSCEEFECSFEPYEGK